MLETQPYMEIWKSGSLTIFTFFDGEQRFQTNSAQSVYDLTQYAKSAGYTEEEFTIGRESGARTWKFTRPEDKQS